MLKLLNLAEHVDINIKYILYGTKILHGIKFYGFTVVGRAVKLKSINFYYYVAKILSCLDNRKI